MTVTSSRAGGVSTQARLRFQAPAQMRLDVEPNAGALVTGQTIIANGDETLLYEPATKRVRRLPYNVLTAWWRGWDLPNGGPANVILAGLAPQSVQQSYQIGPAPVAGGARTVQLTARPEVGRLWLQEDVRFGGGGKGAYYAVFKRAAWDRPATIDLAFDAAGAVTQRQEFDGAGHVLDTCSLISTGGQPQTASVTDAANHAVAQFTYDLKAPAAAFPADVFATNPAPGQIVEDLELQALATYQRDPSAAGRFNLGVALAKHTEDYPAAFAAWSAAAQLEPRATAPHFAAFDAAIGTRDLARAGQEVDALEGLLGAGSFDVAARRATLASLRHDSNGVQTALDVAQAAQPRNLTITLSRADLARTRHDTATAQTLLLDILKSPDPQPLTQVAAAEMLASLVAPTDTAAMDGLLAALPKDTQWQRLARAHLELWSGRPAEQMEFESDAAQASLAVALERQAQDTAARAAWARIITRASVAAANAARLSAMALEARSGTAGESLRYYHDIISQGADESSRRRLQDTLIGAWRKAYKQDQLRAGLQQLIIAPNASEEDWRLWLAFQEATGTDEDIASAIQGGLAKFPRGAWWQSHWAEYLMDQAAAMPASATQYARDALKAVEAAIAADPAQPFYQIQRTLILTQRAAAAQGVVIDSSVSVAARNAARQALDQLTAAWPNDPDVKIAIAMQNIVLEPNNYDLALQGLEQGLREGHPGRESSSGDRHTTASSVHQTLASLYRRSRRPAAAQREYELLLDAVRDAGTEASLARNYLILLAAPQDASPQPLADFLTRLAREPWPYASAREMIENVSGTLAPRQPLILQVATLLRDSNDPAAHLAAAYLNQAILQVLQAQVQRAAAPPEPGVPPRRPTPTQDWAARAAAAARELAQSWQALQPIATGGDKLLAARAAGLLAENALTAHQPDRALQYLTSAVEAEPRDLDLRTALAAAYRAASQKDQTTATANELLTTVPRTSETLRRAATIFAAAGAPAQAAPYAVEALNMAQAVPDIGVGDFETAALIAARALFDAGQTASAVGIYTNLALPQWDATERTAALTDLEAHYRKKGQNAEADQVHAQITALNLTASQARTAANILSALE